MTIEEQAAAAIISSKEALKEALKRFFDQCPEIEQDKKQMTTAIGKVIGTYSDFLTTVNKWISELHASCDFFIRETLQKDYLITISNVFQSSFGYLDAFQKLGAQHDIAINPPRGESYRLLQSYVNTFADKDTRESLIEGCRSRNISLSGFQETFQPTRSRPGTLYSIKNLLMINFFKVISDATKAVPFVKYAVGLAGIAALIALVKSYNLDFEVGVWGTIIVLALMTILFLLSKAAKNSSSFFYGPSKVLIWAMVLIFVTVVTLLVSCAFFSQPKDLRELFHPQAAPPIVDTLPKKDPSQISYVTIEGHVYRADQSPVEGMNVILSINGINPSVTASNGGFTFMVNASAVPDTILINVWSNATGYSSKKFARTDLGKGCDIVLKPQKPLAPRQPRPVIPDLCKTFYRPLRLYLDSSAVLYRNYKQEYRLADATGLYNLDKKMLQLIRTNAAYIPQATNDDIGMLIQHLSVWTSAYERKAATLQKGSGATLRIEYTGDNFPAASAHRILASRKCK